MDDLWYQMIFKRKSFHIFKDRQTISDIELRNIEENIKNFKSLDEGIKTAFQIVPAGETSCKRGEEYCILLYSEKKGDYLRNIGYIGEQDLTKAAMIIQSRTFDAFMPLLAAAVIYLALVMLLTFFMNKLERRLRNSER